MNRRAVLAAAPAAFIPYSIASAMPVSQTPLRRLYREWVRATEYANDRSEAEDDEFDRRVQAVVDLERRIDLEPFRCAEDLALKIMVAADGWAFALHPSCNPGLCAEIEHLAGVAR